MAGSSLRITWSEWQCRRCSWYWDLACACKRQRGAHTIQDWATRNAASVAAVTSRLSGREVGSRWEGLLCIIDVETSTERSGATGRARSSHGRSQYGGCTVENQLSFLSYAHLKPQLGCASPAGFLLRLLRPLPSTFTA